MWDLFVLKKNKSKYFKYENLIKSTNHTLYIYFIKH